MFVHVIFGLYQIIWLLQTLMKDNFFLAVLVSVLVVTALHPVHVEQEVVRAVDYLVSVAVPSKSLHIVFHSSLGALQIVYTSCECPLVRGGFLVKDRTSGVNPKRMRDPERAAYPAFTAETRVAGHLAHADAMKTSLSDWIVPRLSVITIAYDKRTKCKNNY
uniref:Uncharacterized protein n=1 Tax=Clastoptera arizonana TaxID=38151 RepID=A0A1B6EFF7_9HEMI